MKFNKKEMETINKVLELEDLEPENNHLRIFVIRPLDYLFDNFKYMDAYEAKYRLEYFIDELNGYGYEKCRKKIYNRRLKALRTMINNKIQKIK